MRPPSIQVVNHQLQHAVGRPIVMEMSLKQETPASCPEDGNFAIECLFEPERLVEFLG
jgi:hypothetical protein